MSGSSGDVIHASAVVLPVLKEVLSPTPGARVGRRTASSERLPVFPILLLWDTGGFLFHTFVAVYLIPVGSRPSTGFHIVLACFFS